MRPFESLLQDRAVMDELRQMRRLPATTLPLAGTPSAGTIAEAARRLSSPEGAESAATGEIFRGFGAGAEAIVLAFGRPTLLVQDHSFATPELEEWRRRLEPLRGVLERVLPSIGRIEFRRLPRDAHLGTGWLVAEDVVVTNRHVAEIFTRGSGRTAVLQLDPFGRAAPVQIDFREEQGRSVAAEYPVAQVLWVEEVGENWPDLALLKLARGSAELPPPIPMRASLPRPGADVIAVVGYPAWDYRNDAAVMTRVFGDIFGVKRLAPGYVTRTDGGLVFEHDCSTLGGNSGSVVLDAASGMAVGLHFAGEFGVRNLAVRAEALMKRLSELEVRVAVPTSFGRLGDQPPPASDAPEAARPPASYVNRQGFRPDFVPGAAGRPDFSEVAPDLARGELLSDGTELRYVHFSVWMSASRRQALCAAVNIDGKRLIRFARSADRWTLDPRLGPEQQIGNELYARNRLDRGHLVRRLDPAWGPEEEARQAMEDTFHYTNASPQHEELNQGPWNELEDYILDNADAHDLKINVFTGPVFQKGDQGYRDVEVPAEYWKIVVMSRRGPDGTLRPLATAYLLSQADLLGHIEFAFGACRTWQVPLSLVEQKTGLRFPELRRHDPLEGGAEGASPSAQLIRSWRDIVLAGTPAGGRGPEATPSAPERLKGRLRAAQRRASLDFVAEFDGAPPEDMLERVRAVVPVVAGVEPVFERDERFQRIRLPGVEPGALDGASPFDLTEPLRRALGARSVEPDLPTDFFPEAPPEEAALGRESLDVLGCWTGDSEPAPSDPVWALRRMRVPEAWDYSTARGRPSQGLGVLIAQPDTGVTDHPELAGTFDKSRWADLLDGGEPWDPLIKADPADTPGHGTATGSVAVSRGGLTPSAAQGAVTGSAPAATLVPIRCIESVVRITQSRVARAVEHAVEQGCHVITMSLGGVWSRALAVAVDRAVRANVLVLAAAGNCVRFVVWPARFSQCVAVGGSNARDGVWKGSSRGAAVDVSAPAQHVYRARRGKDYVNPADYGPGEGTSFAVALTAGVAALWLAHHGRQRLIDGLSAGETLQDRFLRLLRRTARRPEGWDQANFGAGVVDALALLEADPDAPGTEAAMRRAGTAMDADQGQAALELLNDLGGGAEGAAASPEVLETHGLELMWLALERARRPLGGREGVEGPVLSEGLKAALARPENGQLAARLAFGASREEAEPWDLEADPHADPEQPSPERVFEGPEATPRPWRVANSLQTLLRQVNARYPERNRASDGTIGDDRHRARTSDHNAWIRDGDYDVVSALDITHDPARGCDMNALVAAIRASRDPRVKYVIWDRRIMNSTIKPWEWRPYAGSNPHTRHVHISVVSDKARYDDAAPWRIQAGSAVARSMQGPPSPPVQA